MVMRMAREFELSTPIDGTADQAWAVLTDFDAYPQWSRLVPFWPLLRHAMTRFSEFGTDLNARVSDMPSGAV